MTRILAGGFAFALLAAPPVQAEASERNVEIVRRMTEAINQRDLDALDDLVAADVQRHCAATPGVVVRSLEEFKEFLRSDFVSVPDSRQEIQQIFGAGDRVAARVLYRGTQTGPMGPFPPSGRPLEIPFVGILRIEANKIAEIWVEWDNLAALGQLGFWPPPSDESEQANAALARRWFDEVINQRNLDALPEIYAADYAYHGQGGLEMRGLEQVRGFAAAILAGSDDRRAVVERQVVDGDRVVTQFRSRGTHTGTFQGIEPTGKEWVTEGIVISRIENGKIVEDWEVIHSSGLGN
jgi:predicted ester cyclase